MSWVLKGPSAAFDKREWFAGPDVVEVALAGDVGAMRYIEPLPLVCTAPRVMIRVGPGETAEAVSELLFGEGFALADVVGDWAFGRRMADRYIGWVPLAALGDPGAAPTHHVTARRAPVFAQASIKAAALMELPYGAALAGTVDGAFLALAGGGFVHRRHAESPPADRFVAAALFMGAPYLWGGRTPDGVDCSGLVQAALAAEGVALKRDTDQQLQQGEAVDFAARQRGDLVFFSGHVGLLTAPDTLLHANAHWMSVVEEPLADVVARGAAIAGVRRL